MIETNNINPKMLKFLPWLGAMAIFMQALDGTILNTSLPTIAKELGKSPLEINEETQNLHRKVLEKGAKILRVHDVAETKMLLRSL